VLLAARLGGQRPHGSARVHAAAAVVLLLPRGQHHLDRGPAAGAAAAPCHARHRAACITRPLLLLLLLLTVVTMVMMMLRRLVAAAACACRRHQRRVVSGEAAAAAAAAAVSSQRLHDVGLHTAAAAATAAVAAPGSVLLSVTPWQCSRLRCSDSDQAATCLWHQVVDSCDARPFSTAGSWLGVTRRLGLQPWPLQRALHLLLCQTQHRRRAARQRQR
jgi:hypothetical protein